MDQHHVVALRRTVTSMPSRRDVLRGLVGVGLGLGALRRQEAATARKKKNKKKPLQFNEFGCVNVGGKCRGKDDVCCSGICEGKKPKKGKQDQRTCVAHNTGGCTLDRDYCFNPQVAACSKTAKCLTTTGNAPFCAENTGETFCQPCAKDKDCEALGFGAGAACVILRTQGICVNGCEGINGSSGNACFPPGA